MDLLPLPLPSSLDEAEALILALYQPAAPGTVARTQDALQRLQRSPAGWQFAQGMLARSSDAVKFFGALTIIIKLNTEGSTLDDQSAEELLHYLIGCFVRSLADGSAALVIRKLASALVTFFVHFPHLWPDCVRHLLYCLDVGHAVPVKEANNAVASETVASLDETKLLAALWFAAALVEETTKIDMKSQKYSGVHNRMLKSFRHVSALMDRGFSTASPNSAQIQEDTLKCLQSWILYEQRIPPSNDGLTSALRGLIIPALSCIDVEDVSDTTMELFIDILQNYSGFLTDEHYEALSNLFESSWSRDRYMQLVGGDFDFSLIQYGILTIAFGDAKVMTLMEGTDDRSRRMLQRLCGLLNCNGQLVGEDKIFVPALEFWATFVETLTDTVYVDEATTYGWLTFSVSQVMDAVLHSFRKAQMINPAEWNEMDSNDRAGWTEARKDIADFLQAVYALRGKALVKIFVDLLLQSLPQRHWDEMESALFCLGSISDCIGDDGECDEGLHKVFSSELFELVGPGPARAHIPTRLLQTSLSTIERYSDFFERNQRYLPAALNLLFSVVGEDVSLGGPSSKSIMTLCSSCRSLLKEHIDGFLEHYQQIHSLGVDSLAEERIMAGIACIIQAIPDEPQRLGYVQQLVSILHEDAQKCLGLKDHPESADKPPIKDWLEARLRFDLVAHKTAPPASPYEAALLIAERVLRCMTSVARGMQSMSEGVLDLDSEPEKATMSMNEGLSAIQTSILMVINLLDTSFGHAGEITDTICNIFRAGFSETEQGPFVFPPGTMLEYFGKQTSQHPRIGTIISTACSFISSLNSRPKAQVMECLSHLLPWVINLLKEMPEPDGDPEMSQNGIEFVHRAMSKYPEALLQLQPTSDLEFFFYFALKVLDGKEPLPKGSAADLWSAFLTLKSADQAVEDGFRNALTHLGPLLSRSLIQNIGGNASRSELDKLSDPLKKLVVQHPLAQQWLEKALLDPSFPSAQVSQSDKYVFLKKVINLRGARQTNQVVREFWLACRGSSFAYAS